ncbi:MAG: shikimate kinase [Intestinimonas sp.]
MAPLKSSGTVVFLCRDPGETFDTVPMDARPLAQEGREAFLARFRDREPAYRFWADQIVTDFSSPEATVNAILEGLS